MTHLFVVENKMSDIRKYLLILDRYKNYRKEEIEQNVDLKGAVERYMYLAMQSAIDLAEAVISYKKLRKPSTFGEAFLVLQEAGFISPNLSKNLIKMAGLRNIITHEYAELDFGILYSALQERLVDISIFAQEVEKISQ